MLSHPRKEHAFRLSPRRVRNYASGLSKIILLLLVIFMLINLVVIFIEIFVKESSTFDSHSNADIVGHLFLPTMNGFFTHRHIPIKEMQLVTNLTAQENAERANFHCPLPARRTYTREASGTLDALLYPNTIERESMRDHVRSKEEYEVLVEREARAKEEFDQLVADLDGLLDSQYKGHPVFRFDSYPLENCAAFLPPELIDVDAVFVPEISGDEESPCSVNPCQHGGTCIAGSDATYTCHCVGTMFMGEHCEVGSGSKGFTHADNPPAWLRYWPRFLEPNNVQEDVDATTTSSSEELRRTIDATTIIPADGGARHWGVVEQGWATLPSGQIVRNPSDRYVTSYAYSAIEGLLYVHNYKVAGGSIRTGFFPGVLCGYELDPEDLHEDVAGCDAWQVLGEAFYDDLVRAQLQVKIPFWFSFVRNPWDRHVSSYFFFKKHPVLDSIGWLEDAPFPTFTEFALDPTVVNLRSLTRNMHHRPQYMSLVDTEGKFLVDFIGRMESMLPDIYAMLLHMENDVLIEGFANGFFPMGKRHQGDHPSFQSMYTSETAAAVACYYQVDIELFGYYFGEAPADSVE